MNRQTLDRQLETLPPSLRWRVAGALDGAFAPRVAVELVKGWPAGNRAEARHRERALRLAERIAEGADSALETRRERASRRQKQRENG